MMDTDGSQQSPTALWRGVAEGEPIEGLGALAYAALAEHLSLRGVALYRLESNGAVRLLTQYGTEPPTAIERTVIELLIRGDEWVIGRPVPLHALPLGGQSSDGPVQEFAIPLGKKDDESLGFLVLRLDAKPQIRLSRLQGLAEAVIEPLTVALTHDRKDALPSRPGGAKRNSHAGPSLPNSRQSIVGADGDLKTVMERVDLVAPSNISVLILGETGSGKELVARAIHDRSPRAAEAFIRVNCGAMPPELIDSELFGHERGSFTGAVGQRQGWFERADGGTLFLDEVGELPPSVQVRLLRVLQEGVFQRIGGQTDIHVDVRIVTATHRDLAAMVADGQFRQDLWYRIAGFPIVLPALRDRPGDLPALTEHMARRAADRLGLPVALPTAEDLHLLARYDWPGNVRELSAVIDRAAILGRGERLDVPAALGLVDLGEHFRPESASPEQPDSHPAGSFPTLEDVQRQHILAALDRCGGRVEGPQGAARLLAINPNTLRSRMRKLGIRVVRAAQ